MRILSIAVISIILVALFFSCDLLNPGLGDRVDISAPLVFVSSHGNGSYVHGSITLAGSFEEDMNASTIEISFDGGVTYNSGDVATIDAVAGTWSYDWDTLSVVDGEYNLVFHIIDTSGKTTDRNLLVYVDNTGPLVLMSTPSIPSAVYYGSAFILRGEAADHFGVTSVDVDIYAEDGTTFLESPTVSGASTWSCTFNSATWANPTGILKFRISAIDKAGNTSSRFYHYYNIFLANDSENVVIDDIYRILNGELSDEQIEAYLAANDGTALIPLEFDQEQNKPAIEVYNPDEDILTPDILTSTSKLSGKAMDSDGVAAGSVEVQIVRQSDSVVMIPWATTGNPISPSVNWSFTLPGGFPPLADASYNLYVRAQDISANSRTVGPFAFSIDSGAPTLIVNTPSQGQYLNGNFTISGTASDAQGISLVEVSINNGVSYNPASGTTSWTYSVTSPPDGSMLIKVRATEGGGGTKITTYNLQVIVDTTDPGVTFINPALSATVNGQVIFKGTASDNTQITLVELKIGKNDPFITLAGTYNWEYTIDSTSYANGTHATETPPASNVWKLDVQARATDVANNVTTLSTYYIYIDNDTDKPQVNIIAPSNGQNIGGPVLISGTAVDDDAVAYVQMQMDINGDGDFTDLIDTGNGTSKTLDSDTNDRFENETLWYTLTGTTAWTEMINNYGELYERIDTTPDLNGNVTIRIRAVDINAVPVTGNYQQIAIHLDDTIPRIENLNYASSDYVKGTFQITGDAYDDEQVSSIWLSYNGGVDYTDITGNTAMVTYDTVDHRELHITINSSTYVPVSGIFYVRLKVIDNANYQTISYLNLNVDNQYPTGSYTIAADDIYGNGTNSRLQGMAWDSGTVAGIDKIELYFTRGTGPYTLYSPTGAGTTAATSNDFGDGGGSVPYMTTGEKTNFAISIDKATELGDDNSGNGDNDGYNESLTLSGSDYNWWAQFGPDYNSTSITDGAITIHYVVFDKAGNGHHYAQSGFIKNNKPTITTLTTGTDLNMDNDTADLNERFTYGTTVYARNRLYVGIAATDNNAITDYRVYHPNGSGTLVQATATGDIDISSYGEGVTTFLCRVTDSDGIIVERTIDVVIDNVDGTDPVVTLHDLVTSDQVSGSLTVGHIELAGASPYNGAADPDVSGTIVLRGHMHDNQRIQYFNMAIDSFDLGSGAGTEVALLTWPNTNTAGTYGNLTISNVTLTESTGHDFDWTYTWNTANLSTRTGNDITVSVRAQDFNPNSHTVTRDHDVVPYITGILRNNMGIEGTTRSKYGNYTVQQGETNIYINGFNLAKTGTYGTNSWVRVYNNAGAAYDEVANGSVSVFDTTYTQLRIANLNDITHSGWLRVMVNNIEAINYVNNDSLIYNKEDDGSGYASTLWNDDRYLRVWRVGTSFNSSTNAQYPSMSIETDGDLIGAWVDYTTAASVFYGTTTAAPTPIFQMYDPAEFTDVHVDTSNNITVAYLGNYYGGSGWDSSIDSAGSINVYNASAPAQVQRGWAYPWNYFYRFEMLYHNEMLMQFQRPKVVRSGNNIHLAYYDISESPAYPSVKYGYALNADASTAEKAWINLDGGTDGDALVVANGETRSTSAGEYLAIDADEQGYPVVVYYDTSNQTLRMARASSLTPTGIANWTRQTVFLADDPNRTFVGKYVAIKFDASGNLHVVCNRTSTGDLIYIRAADVDGGATAYTFDYSVVVDSEGAVGAWADISTNATTPYISYLNSSMSGTFSGLKMAYYDTTNSRWEYEIAPLSTAILENRTNIEYAKGTVDWAVTLGYKGNAFDVIQLRPEE